MKRYAIALAMLATLMLVSGAQAATTVTWTSGVSGFWDTDVQWDSGGGLGNAVTVFGDSDGWDSGELIADANIIIDGTAGTTDVLYDADFEGGDFKMNSGPGGTGALTISNGATLELRSTTTDDGKWTEIDAALVRVDGAGSVLSRTHTDDNKSAGAFIFGSWRNDPGEKMDLEIVNGGTVDNQGQMWFGAWDDSEDNLDITWTIGEKSSLINRDYLGVNGLVGLDQPGSDPDAGINFIYNWDAGAGETETNAYDIDITGHGGRVSVGIGQIKTQEKTGPNDADWVTTVKTYEDLYADGLLLSSGSNAGAFGDSFTVIGSTGDANYEVRSIVGAVDGGAHAGDISGDCLVNAIDAGTMFANFGAGAGTTVAQGNLNGSIDIDAADAGVMFANWTGDPGPVGAGEAAAEYNPATGEIVVSVNGVNNWYVQSDSFSLTGDAPNLLGELGAQPSDNDQIIGETGFAVFSFTDHNIGAVAAAGLELGDLNIYWNAGFGEPLLSAVVSIVPEPATIALAAFGICGVLTARRRRVA